MERQAITVTEDTWKRFRDAVKDETTVAGLTHSFYRYPARFSPTFARAAIEAFSLPGQLVLDPFMGGGTTAVEAVACNRRVVGTDLNSLAVFVAKAKTTPLSEEEEAAARFWATQVIPEISYRQPRRQLAEVLDDSKTRNLHIPYARVIKKLVASSLWTVEILPSARAEAFARCAILRTAQWALDGRRTPTVARDFRERLTANALQMLQDLADYRQSVAASGSQVENRSLYEWDATRIHSLPHFAQIDELADLVVTSPPYAGVHVLYHRWQVDGRKETQAPYWVADCNDGQGASHYNFGDRRQRGLTDYFSKSQESLRSIRRIVKPGALLVQLVAFSEPRKHLPRYLAILASAGFAEVAVRHPGCSTARRRIWRNVPNRRWHATSKGRTNSSREVVLIHRAE